MGQSHSHNSAQPTEDKNARRLLLAFCVTAGFMVVEVAGGLISGSLALLADAGHMLTDAAAECATYLWLAAADHAGGFSQCHCFSGHYDPHRLGGHSALSSSAAGGR